MNRDFVNVKVDREERPDVDTVYMAATQALTGQGGWPMTVFLTPDRRPFYAGTYFPPTARQGMPAFTQVLDAVSSAWRDRRDEVVQSAGGISDQLAQQADTDKAVDAAIASLRSDVAAMADARASADFEDFAAHVSAWRTVRDQQLLPLVRQGRTAAAETLLDGDLEKANEALKKMDEEAHKREEHIQKMGEEASQRENHIKRMDEEVSQREEHIKKMSIDVQQLEVGRLRGAPDARPRRGSRRRSPRSPWS